MAHPNSIAYIQRKVNRDLDIDAGRKASAYFLVLWSKTEKFSKGIPKERSKNIHHL